MIKIEIVKGEVYRANGKYGPGKILEVEDKEADRLIALGAAKKAEKPSGKLPEGKPSEGGKP